MLNHSESCPFMRIERSFQIDESNVQVTALTELSSLLDYEAKSRYLVDR